MRFFVALWGEGGRGAFILRLLVISIRSCSLFLACLSQTGSVFVDDDFGLVLLLLG